MSGPKVVNIEAVRRQQRREGTGRLRELRAALGECLQLQAENPTGTFEFRQRAEGLLAGLDRLSREERWGDLSAETTAHRDFYLGEAGRLRREAARRTADVLRREHRRRLGAEQLTRELRSLPTSPGRERALRRLDAVPADEEDWGAAVAVATAWLAEARGSAAAAVATGRLRALAAALEEPVTATGTAPVLPGAPPDPDEARLERCWALLGELGTDAPAGALVDWQAKARAAAGGAPEERALRLDSLALELAAYLREQRNKRAAVVLVTALLDELAPFGSPGAEIWRTRLKEAANHSDALQVCAAEARAWMAEEHRGEDARAQRSAVLRALGALGYEVREGLESAWIEQGRVVVHRPQEPGYGVELSAPAASAGVFQARVVATGATARSPQRDRETEETWCSEFARARALLGAEGYRTDLRQAHAPGTIPIKVVAAGAGSDGRARPAERPTRTRQTPSEGSG